MNILASPTDACATLCLKWSLSNAAINGTVLAIYLRVKICSIYALLGARNMFTSYICSRRRVVASEREVWLSDLARQAANSPGTQNILFVSRKILRTRISITEVVNNRDSCHINKLELITLQSVTTMYVRLSKDICFPFVMHYAFVIAGNRNHQTRALTHIIS